MSPGLLSLCCIGIVMLAGESTRMHLDYSTPVIAMATARTSRWSILPPSAEKIHHTSPLAAPSSLIHLQRAPSPISPTAAGHNVPRVNEPRGNNISLESLQRLATTTTTQSPAIAIFAVTVALHARPNTTNSYPSTQKTVARALHLDDLIWALLCSMP